MVMADWLMAILTGREYLLTDEEMYEPPVAMPESDDQVFVGWFDAETGGNKVTTFCYLKRKLILRPL